MSETYRHELKYPIDMGTYLSLRQRLRTVMKTDSHAVNCTPFVRQYDILSSKWGVNYAKRSTK